MDVLRVLVRRNQLLIAGTMRQYPQLNLRIIRVHEHAPFLRHEHLADQPSQFHAHRDVLQIRIRAADTPGGRDGLVELPVDAAVTADKVGQAVRISRFQLRQLAIFQNLFHHRAIRGQLFQHVRRRGIPALRLLPVFQPHMLEQDDSELLRGIDVERLPRQSVNLLLQLDDPPAKLLAVYFQGLALDLHALALHVVKHEQ